MGMGMLPIKTSTSDKLFSRINIDDCEKLIFQSKGYLLFFFYLRRKRTLQE